MVKVLDRCSVAARIGIVNSLSAVDSGARTLRATAECECSEKECDCVVVIERYAMSVRTKNPRSMRGARCWPSWLVISFARSVFTQSARYT
jgi:hypothetical protein